jgi:hypothetical protein
VATYKVLQDIEAEDKLLGPLTLKQFVFAVVTIGLGFIEFKLATAPGPVIIKLPFIFMILLPMIVFGFLAAPISRDQPNDIWLLARLRFLIRPHKRIWNQDGISELVTITVPKKVEEVLTDGLTQGEVRSRLSALANTLDSRGWAIKNVNTNLYAQPDYITTVSSDRLVAPSSLPQDVPPTDIVAADDMLDTASNITAQHLDEMIQASTQAHRREVISHIQSPTQQPQTPQDYWFMNQSEAPKNLQPNYTTFNQNPVVTPGAATDVVSPQPVTADDSALLEKIHKQQAQGQPANGHLRTLQPLHDKNGNPVAQPAAAPDPSQSASQDTPAQAPAAIQPTPEPVKTQTTTPNPAILGLAQNDDLNVATIARQAEKLKGNDDGEVVISLH